MGCTGYEGRLRVVVSSGVVHLAAVVLAAVEARTQGGRSLHGESVGWGSRQRPQRWRQQRAAAAGHRRRTVRRFGGAAAGWLLWFDGGGARPSSLGLEAFSCSARAWLGLGLGLGIAHMQRGPAS